MVLKIIMGFTAVIFLSLEFLSWVAATPGYYRTYQVFGSGDNIINTMMAHGGPGASSPNRKWNVECLDGEAVVGILDGANDYTTISQVWCKYMFPYKPPSNGIYPYYPNCFAKNFTTQFFCYTPKFHDPSVDTFITGFWDDEFAFNVYRPRVDDKSPYKCCKAPTGYYIDYSSCYYQQTRDQFWEYYDTPQYFLVTCATGYVATGIAKKGNPYSGDIHIEWIQCCRVGFGAGPNIPPPSAAIADYSYDNSSSGVYGQAAAYSGGVGNDFARPAASGIFRSS